MKRILFLSQSIHEDRRVVYRKFDDVLIEPVISIGTQTDEADDPTDDKSKTPMLNVILPVPLLMIPVSVSDIVSSVVSSKRVMKFLLAPEVEGDRGSPLETTATPKSKVQKVKNQESVNNQYCL